MTFLNPLVLLGLAAAAIPLIIHLFNFRKPRKVDFSSLVFIKALEKTTMQRVRIKQWLLLLLRTLAIAALVLAFARPTVTSDVGSILGGEARSTIGILVDNSLSMGLRDAGGAYLDQAKAVARALLSETRVGDDVVIELVAGPERTRKSEFASASSAIDFVDGVEPAPSATPLARAAADLASYVGRTSNLNKEVYLITDGQQSTLGDSLVAEVDADVRVYLVPIGDRAYENRAVTGVHVDSRIIEKDQPVQISAEVVNYGDAPFDGYAASVYLEDRRVAQASATLPPRVPTLLSFTLNPADRGWLRGEVRGEDDDFEPDNIRYFSLHVPERRDVLLVRGEGADLSYIEAALSPNLGGARGAFQVTRVAETGLASQQLASYDVVVLVGLKDISSGEIAMVSRYVDQGGGLLVFPGIEAKASDYDALFEATGGGRWGGVTGTPGGDVPVTRIDRIELEHPIFSGVFESPSGGSGAVPYEKPDVFLLATYHPSRGSEQTVVTAGNGMPFVQELRHGSGQALFVAVAPDPDWSDLPVSGFFVPLIYRSIFYLSSTESTGGDQLLVGAPGQIRVAGLQATDRVSVIGPDGVDFIPEQRTTLGSTVVDLGEQVAEPGIFEVTAGDRLLRRVAFNLDTSESDLQRLDARDAAARIGELMRHDVRMLVTGRPEPAAVIAAMEAERGGIELWNVFLVVALLLLVGEMMLAKLWQPEST